MSIPRFYKYKEVSVVAHAIVGTTQTAEREIGGQHREESSFTSRTGIAFVCALALEPLDA
jgi:hypothetical protein